MGSSSSSRVIDNVHAGTDKVLHALTHQSQDFVKLLAHHSQDLVKVLELNTKLIQGNLNTHTILLQTQIGALSSTIMMAAIVVFAGIVLWTMVYWHTNRRETNMLYIETRLEIEVDGRKKRAHTIVQGSARDVQGGYLGVVWAQTQALMFEEVQPSVRPFQQVPYRRRRQLNERGLQLMW